MLGLWGNLGAQHRIQGLALGHGSFLLAPRIFDLHTQNHTLESASRVLFARLTTWIVFLSGRIGGNGYGILSLMFVANGRDSGADEGGTCMLLVPSVAW